MKLINYLPFLLCIALYACGGNTSSEAENVIEEINSKEPAKANTCLAKLAMTPCAVLSAELIAKHAGMKVSDFEKEDPHEILKDSRYMFCRYSWESDRTMTMEVMNKKMEMPMPNSIQVGGFRVIDEKETDRYKQTVTEYFESRHKNTTEEELKQLQKSVEERMQGKSETEKEAAKSMISMTSKMNFEDVKGIGDIARWEVIKSTKECILHVLKGNVSFRIACNVSDDSAVNFELAKKLANEVLALCE